MDEHRTSVNDQRSFRRAPQREIVASVSRVGLDDLLSELAELGYDSVEVLVGADGLDILDQAGQTHGLRGRIMRGLQQLGTEEENLVAYSDALQAGRAVIGVAADPRDDLVVEAFARHDGQHVVSYGLWSATDW